MKHLCPIFSVVLFVSGMAYAQDNATYIESTTEPTVIELPETPAPAPAQAPQVVIMPTAQQPVVAQPKTYVEASPLVKSRAEQLRDSRKNVEIQTEQKIVEKLEESRMQDEQDRADRLFGDRFANKEEAPHAPVAAPVYPVTPVAVQHVPTTVVEDDTDEKLDAMKTDIIESVRADIKSVKEEKKQSDDRTYIGGLVGGGEYPGLVNVESNESFGFVIGTETDNFVLEASYQYSNYYVSESILVFKDMDQHNFMATAKYSILTGRVRPQVGAAASYTQRKYTDVTQGFNGWPGIEGNEFESTGFDVGLVLALDVIIRDNFSLGMDYRYMTNLTHNDDYNTPYRNALANSGVNQLIEESDYQIISVSGKFSF